MADEDSARIYPMAVLDRHYDESSVSMADTEMDDEVYNRFLDAEEDDKACNGYYDISSHAFPGRFDYEDKNIDRSFHVPSNIPKNMFAGDERMDELITINWIPKKLEKWNRWFWKNYENIRPLSTKRDTMGRINHIIGFRFQERGVPNETGIMAHWLDDKYVPWLKVRIKDENDFFCFRWEPMSVTMESSIAPEVAFYVLKEGLIHQDKSWWSVEACIGCLCVSPEKQALEDKIEGKNV